MEKIISVVASPNIAFVKYWGKKDNKLKIATNDSISMTLSADVVCTKTTILLSNKLKKDTFFLNGIKREDDNLRETLEMWRERIPGFGSEIKILIISENNFPTASGLASSASGYAALAVAVGEAFGITDPKEQSMLARMGSGSASRSIFGGFVGWKAGEKKDGTDSYAYQIAPKKHWDDLVDVVGIISKKEKKVSSRAGMEATTATSQLYSKRMEKMKKTNDAVKKTIMEKDFSTLMREIMQDSNSMHAVMLDTWPPISYLNDTSKEIIEKIHEYNEKEIKAGYTFDAGPNAHIITTKKNSAEVKKLLLAVKGVQDVLVVPVGEGPKILAPDNEIVRKFKDKE